MNHEFADTVAGIKISLFHDPSKLRGVTMLGLGEVKKIEIDSTGLEGCVEIYFANSIGLVNCYVLLAESYEPYTLQNEVQVYQTDDEPIRLKLGDITEFKLSIVFVSMCKEANKDTQEGFIQPKSNSCCTNFVAFIKKIADENTAICSIGKLGEDILVDFEESLLDINAGDMIQFNGEIKVEVKIIVAGSLTAKI